ncbi:sulfatase [Candidatus Poriferisocius sp.]|uniref:sulfatase family protein n=1 Tax=Candidatus Poriferisocius sp. TaxID=3101276 RepID=UPI003B522A88
MADQDGNGTTPNVLLITTDQHRWDWLGCHGTPGVVTPQLDALAGRGTRITGHVTNSSVCVPARIGLATGRTPLSIGAQSNNDVLDSALPTYYQQLRDAGYKVGVVGKLDLDKGDLQHGPRGDRPKAYRWGFTHPIETLGKILAGLPFPNAPSGPYNMWLQEQGLWEGFRDDYSARMHEIFAGRPGFGGEKSLSDLWYRDSVLPTEAWVDHWIGRKACEWLEEVPSGFPWHLYVSFCGPHDPFDPPREFGEQFRDADVPEPVLDEGTPRAKRFGQSQSALPPDELMKARRQYTAELAAIDIQIGEILATLDAIGQTEDTIVMFTADHGEMLGDHRLFQKHYGYEPSMRIPMIAAGPGISNGVSNALTELIDVTATILDYTGTEIEEIDGRSLRPIFEHAESQIRDATTCTEHQHRSIRTDQWKYIHNVQSPDDPHELYNLFEDPDETTNLIDSEPSIAEDLLQGLVELLGAEEVLAPIEAESTGFFLAAEGQ